MSTQCPLSFAALQNSNHALLNTLESTTSERLWNRTTFDVAERLPDGSQGFQPLECARYGGASRSDVWTGPSSICWGHNRLPIERRSATHRKLARRPGAEAPGYHRRSLRDLTVLGENGQNPGGTEHRSPNYPVQGS